MLIHFLDHPENREHDNGDPDEEDHAPGVVEDLTDQDEEAPGNWDQGNQGVEWRRERPLLALIAPAQDEDPEEGQRVEAIDREDTEVWQVVGVKEAHHDRRQGNNKTDSLPPAPWPSG